MMRIRFLSITLALAVCALGSACGKSGGSNTGLMALLFMGGGLTTNSIESYSIDGYAGTIDHAASTITVALPCTYSSKAGLVALFSHNGSSIDVAGTEQVSGVTPNDFTSSVTYNVQAENGSIKQYTVTVSVAAVGSKAITAYSINGVQGVINQSTHTITVSLPCSTPSLSGLVAEFSITGQSVYVGATQQTSGSTANSFSSNVTYAVHDCAAGTQNYTVTVTIAPDDSNEITSFSINGQAGRIIGDHIHVAMPKGTDLTSLVATFSAAGKCVDVGATAQISGVTANDFSDPVIYTVTDCNDNTKNYIVEVYAFNEQAISYDDNPDPNTFTGRTLSAYKTESDYKASLVTSQATPLLQSYATYIIVMASYPDFYMDSMGSGSDGKWFTADDTSGSITVKQYIDATHKRIVTCDIDCSINEYGAFTMDTSGRIISVKAYSDAGTDGIWFTADDVLNTWDAAISTTNWVNSNRAESISYEADGTTIIEQYLSTRDTSTKMDVLTIYDADGTTVVTTITSDYSHSLYGTIMSSGPGMEMCVKTKVDGSKRNEWFKIYFDTAPTPDGDWWDGDEVFCSIPDFESYRIWEYDSNGYKVSLTGYSDEEMITMEAHSDYTIF